MTTRSTLELTQEQETFYRRIKMMTVRKQPFIAALINQLIPVSSPGLGTMAVDDGLRLYIDFGHIMEKGYEYAAGVLAHEPWHILRKHNQRAKNINANSPLEQKIFNIAGDLEINDDIKHLIPENGIQPGEDTFADFKPYLNAEDYYFKIVDIMKTSKENTGSSNTNNNQNNTPEHNENTNNQQTENNAGETGDIDIDDILDAIDQHQSCGSGSGGEKLVEYELPADEENPYISDFKKNLTVKQVAEAVANTDFSTIDDDTLNSESLKLWADEVLNYNPIDWREMFNNAVRNAVKQQKGYKDYNYRRLARRQPIKGVLLPARTEPDIRVGIGIDTSYSNITKLGIAVEEIMGIVNKTGIRGRNLLAFSVDNNIETSPDYITNKDDISFQGSGGTDLNIAFDFVAENLKNKIDVFILLTDGEYEDWYEQKPVGAGRIAFIVVLIVDSKNEPDLTSNIIATAEQKLQTWANIVIVDIENL